MKTILIRTGGQTGVDRAALDYAVRRGLPYCGWCPRGGWAEDFLLPPGLLVAYPRLVETPAAAPEQRTAWNVRDSHATLILVRPGDLVRSPGTAFTEQAVELLFLRPCRVADPTDPAAVEAVRSWLGQVSGALGVAEFTLNVAGPRESEAPGIYADAGRFLELLLG